MVRKHRGEYPSLWAAVESIAPKIGCVSQTLLEWVKQDDVDSGERGRVTSAEAQRVRELEREVKALRRANEILSWRARFLSRRSSTADASPEGLRRLAPRHVRRRADLRGLADCPVGFAQMRREPHRRSLRAQRDEAPWRQRLRQR